MDGEIVGSLIVAGLSVIGSVGSSFYWAGKIKSKVEEFASDLKELDKDNKAAHKTIYSTQESIGKSVAKTEEHLRNLNGLVNKNSSAIDSCKSAIDKNTERIFTHTHQKPD
jgi:hypothetical protein